ncbi:AI-2E family transporter [Aliidiomarina minuta]|uniref:AI-2E family transporter n=1 Tax=Aliidiomarina minuta TaxID=880057 RepID=A0A432WA10_9GAMM|nr:AI-2E family transporter [Aliidiomarina minuta]RUO26990.1 AI-2E family transporter [Aliidiomarina minuta]
MSEDNQQKSGYSVQEVLKKQDLTTPIYGLFSLAVLYTLYLAHEILLPIILALLLSMLLAPLVGKAERRLKVPRALSALVLMLMVIALIASVSYGIVKPLSEWADRAPNAIERIFTGESEMERQMDRFSDTAQQIEEEMDDVSEEDRPQPVVLQQESWQSQALERAQQTVFGLALALALTYFLLVSGDMLVKNLAMQMRRRRRQIFLRIVRSGQEQVARYLAVITTTNLSIGILTGLVAWGVGLPTPVLWGLVATLSRFIPYIGVILGVALLTVVSVATFDELWKIAIVPGSFMVMTSIVGFFIEPYIHGMRLAVNPVIIFVSIFFWGWLWGPVGVLLAVPLMTVIMVVVSHIPKLQPLSRVLRK